ncbi:MAG TPA: TonB-dependent receptor [Kiritimatiellia bacterium]|nr:TonB-dependent receptor [Kiritimatiellia bacterium]HRU70296.1 TonB-dependent receptor [Kiritimatiellia bacterium]
MKMSVSIGFLGLLCVSFASAQTNAPVDLGTILVEGAPISKYRTETVSTATFSDARPEELPQTVDVLTEDFIAEMNPADLHDLLRYQAGIYTGGKTMLDRTSGQYTLRGMPGSEVMLDGTLGLAGSMGIFMDPAAFERVEIVKGPVGATQGGVTSSLGPYGAGGSVNLVQKQPRPARSFTDVSMRSTFGEDLQRHRFSLDLNEPIIEEKLTVRMPLSFETGKPFWLPDGARWRETFMLAPSLFWQVRDDLRIGFSLTFQRTDQPAYQGIPIYKGKPFGGYDWDSSISTSGMRDHYLGHTSQAFVEWDASRVWTLRTGAGFAYSKVDFEHLGASGFANANGSIIAPAYIQKPFDHSEGDLTFRRYNIYQRATARYETGPLSHETVMQADFARKSEQGRSYFESVATRHAKHTWVPANYRDTHVDKMGFFAQDIISWQQFRLLGGARVDRHESSLGNSDYSFSPRAGLSYLPTDWLVLFGNVSQTESPNFGYLRAPNDELTSSWQATQYETGLRISPIETLWLSASVYQINQRDTPTLIPNSTYYETEGESESQGFELSLTGNIRDNWSVYTSYAYTRYEDKTTGTSFDRYPPHALTAATSYRLEQGPLRGVVLGLGYRYRHRYDATMRGAYVSKEHFIDDWHVFDCSADVPLSTFGGPKNVTLSLAVKNIFDERYIESNRHYYQCFPGDPRTFEIALQASF